MSEEQTINRPIWDIDTTHPDIVPVLREHLNRIMDPELGLSIIQLGLVRNVTIDEEQAHLIMILTTPFCPYGPAIMESARKEAEKILEIPTKIQYGRETWDPTMMEEGLNDDWGLY